MSAVRKLADKIAKRIFTGRQLKDTAIGPPGVSFHYLKKIPVTGCTASFYYYLP